MPLINKWWKIVQLVNTLYKFALTDIKIPKRSKKMFEYEVIRLGSNNIKNKEMLNKKAEDGWELVSTSPVSRQVKTGEMMGQVVTDIQAFLRKPTKGLSKSNSDVING